MCCVSSDERIENGGARESEGTTLMEFVKRLFNLYEKTSQIVQKQSYSSGKPVNDKAADQARAWIEAPKYSMLRQEHRFDDQGTEPGMNRSWMAGRHRSEPGNFCKPKPISESPLFRE